LKKTVCIVTGTRAEYGLLKTIAQKIAQDDCFKLRVVATGMHLCCEFGYTYTEIENDGFTIDRKIELQLSSDTNVGTVKSVGVGLISFAEYFDEKRPDLLIVLGDRFEIFSCVIAATYMQIPVAHLHGGELTYSLYDEFMRHSITKMASLHFVACEAYRKRVIQLGERPDTVFNVGAMSVENIKNMSLLSIEELEKELNFNLKSKTYCVVTFHPATLEQYTGVRQIRELLDALDAFPDMSSIITKSNSDAGGREINRIWDEYGLTKKNCRVVVSLGTKRYLSALKYASIMIGNSSSGIVEGPASGIPTVNIGDRQKGRIMAESIICCNPEKEDIINAIKRALTQDFQDLAKRVINPYGDGNTSSKILEIMRDQLNGNKLKLKKEFYDIEFKDE
jgi:GDP/UDP-N,N'-diacetylbacillosamine 2-epimerase (hydrolysing)